MAEKDTTEKILEAFNDVFADIVNVLLFNGEEVLKADELVDQAPRAAYKADGQIREIERDVAKRWLNQNIRIACIGLENQTAIDPDMPIRVIGYDGAEYRAELNATDAEGKPKKDRYPVVTLVLYYGHEKHWDKPLNLLGCLNVPEKFKPYVNDYKINLFEIAYLTDEQVKLFKSDFRAVAEFFVQARKNGEFSRSHYKFKHAQETLQLLSVMTHDHRYEELCNDPEKGDPVDMCDVYERVSGIGHREGEIKGVVETCKEMGGNIARAVELLKEKFSLSTADADAKANLYWNA